MLHYEITDKILKAYSVESVSLVFYSYLNEGRNHGIQRTDAHSFKQISTG